MDRFKGSSAPVSPYEIGDLELNTWFERDRSYVGLSDPVTNETILEFWDETVSEMVEDGFLNPKDWKQSLFDYAKSLGIII